LGDPHVINLELVATKGTVPVEGDADSEAERAKSANQRDGCSKAATEQRSNQRSYDREK
jgi:hypothetical protein